MNEEGSRSPLQAAARADAERFGKPEAGWRHKTYIVIFEADTRAGKRFDQWLIALILLSVFTVVLDSVAGIRAEHGSTLRALEWVFTAIFTVEYLTRLACVRHPLRYATSFFGVIDLIAILPSYIAFFIPEAHLLIDVRILRLLRVFRVFKLTGYVAEYSALGEALRASRRKIAVFLSFVFMVVLVMGTLMYVVEGPANGYTSIPMAMYWAITTMSTVGFGDITPQTEVGRFIASAMMLLGWGVLAVPTGIVTTEMAAQRMSRPTTTRTCPECLTEGHLPDANFCRHCGVRMPRYERDPGA
ncbi:ion transporter [Caldimonas caldifontis]|uniref:Ion transporter n=1 Tax=Caldimonas caldifontis TaxID=1452508 RepID=A0A2S5SZG6_9BURK|nr:ion transporter [Caldimonas caldifontis]PPE68173.1 ion transporter [Caldimonas caldifontis]